MLKEKNLNKVNYLQFRKIGAVFNFNFELTPFYIFYLKFWLARMDSDVKFS